jgi:DNA-binding SARP family transcriptional activator
MLIVQILGRFTVSVDGKVIDLPLRSAQTLLAYLILNVGKTHRREQLAGLLWPNTDEANAKGSLRHTLWRLRKALGSQDGLLVDDLTIGFDPQADYWLDAQALGARPAPDASVDALLKVVAAYGGEFLPGFYDDWIVLERERLRTSYEAWMGQLLEKLQAEQRWADVLEWGERWIALGHTPEAAYRALIVAHVQCGDSAAAALTYRRCVDALRADLGVDPSPQTRATYERWLQNDLGAAEVDALPRLVRGYLLEQRVGSGPHGAVYSAVQTSVGRRLAVKVIPPEWANRPDFIRQFEADARLVAQLEHPHIVPLLDYWRDPTGAYLVTRWMPSNVHGQMSNGPLAPAAVTRIVDQVASALAVAERYAIAHLDLRPTNILFDDTGDAYVTDFGVARSAAMKGPSAEGSDGAGQRYDAPEVRESGAGSPLSDVYSLAVIATELLRGGSVVDLDVTNLSRLGLPEAVVRVLQRATACDPAARYASAPAFAAALRAALQQGVEALAPAGSGEISNPFKGLRAFEEIDAGDFFGREALVERLIERLSEGGPLARFLAVVGPSGSGKSSVVKAGLIPALRHGAIPGSEGWYIVTLTPGAHALRNLEAGLISIAAHPLAFLWDQLQTEAHGLVWAADSLLAGVEGRLLLVVDQLEELFTLTESEVERSRFLNLLASAVSEPRSRVNVVVTLRADFTDRPLHYAEFGELMRQRTELVVPLTADELSRAVTGPAQRVGVGVDSDLLAAIVTDVNEEPGALPLLQYALTETFDHRDGRRLTLQAYHETGGVFGALARRADEVFEGLDETDQATARQVFLRLVTLGEGVEDTRRRVLRDELEALDDSPFDTHDASTAALHREGA